MNGLIAGRTGLRVLDDGCGRKSAVKMHERWHVVGIDASADQLARNQRLNESVLDDVQTHIWPANAFDLIVCWDVLEHLPRPMTALDNLASALRPQGVLAIAVPNVSSLKGLLTRLTPFAFHEWFYRTVLGSERPLNRQFPTILRRDIAPGRLRRFAATRRLDIRYCVLYEGSVQKHLRRRHALANALLGIAGGLSRAVSRNQFDLNLTDCIMIMQRNA
jgi:SAM-dependent methyltransferase